MGNNDSRIRRIWHDMKTRCFNKNYDKYDRYGGRGITVCDEWANSFKSFEKWALENGYMDNLTLERINNDKGYCPDNCKWVTRKEQANNRTTSVFYSIENKTMTLQQWATEYNISPQAIQRRIKSGWQIQSAITTPPDKRLQTKRLYPYNGKLLPIKQIARLENVDDGTLRKRLNKGLSIEEALQNIPRKIMEQ